MWEIIKKEWLLLFRSNLFLGVSLGFILILILSVYLGSYENQRKKASYENAKNEMRSQWENLKDMNPHGAAHFGTYVFKPSNSLSGLDEGVGAITGNVLRLEGHVQNEILYSEASQMQSVSRFGKLKSSLLLQYLLPILLVFLAFGSINSEKQSGRLKLLIMQGAGTTKLVLAKTLSIWLYGLGLLVLVVLTHSLLNIQDFNADVFVRTSLFLLVYALYYFIITGLTIFFSTQTHNATIALTFMLGLWILWTIFLPNIFISSVEKWHMLPSRNEMKTAMKEDRSKGIDGHNPSDDREDEFKKSILKKYNVDSLSQLPVNFDGLVMQADEEYGNKVWDKHFGNLRETLALQKQTLQYGGIINPFISLQNTSKGFMASDNLHHQAYLMQAENYRRVFIKTLNDKHAFGGSKTGDWDWKPSNDFFKSVPDFDYKPTSVWSIFSSYLLDLFFLGFWAFAVSACLIFRTKQIEIL